MIVKAFQQRLIEGDDGGDAIACCAMHVRVENMQDRSLDLISIIGRNNTEDLPG
jgi:hypothetical protein